MTKYARSACSESLLFRRDLSCKLSPSILPFLGMVLLVATLSRLLDLLGLFKLSELLERLPLNKRSPLRRFARPPPPPPSFFPEDDDDDDGEIFLEPGKRYSMHEVVFFFRSGEVD